MPGDFEEGSLALHQEVRCVGTVFKLQNNIIYQYRPLYTIIYTLHIQIYTIIYMTNKCHTTTYQFILLYTCRHHHKYVEGLLTVLSGNHSWAESCGLVAIVVIIGLGHHRLSRSVMSACGPVPSRPSPIVLPRYSSTKRRIRILVDGPAKSWNSQA